MSRIGRVLDSLEFPPIVTVKIRKARIAGEFGMHKGEVDVISPRQDLTVQAGPADDKHFVIRRCRRQCHLNGTDDDKAFRAKAWVAAHDEIDATGQRPTERLAGLSSHDEVVPEGKGAKALEVSRQMPRQGVIDADDAVFGDSGD